MGIKIVEFDPYFLQWAVELKLYDQYWENKLINK